MKITWRCEYVRCGNPRCRSCPHGPYWYGYWKEGGRLRKRYHGRTDPRERDRAGRAGGAARNADPADDIFNRETATPFLAYIILGVPAPHTWASIQAAYKARVLECHPDRGGTVLTMQRVTAAYTYLKAIRTR